MPSGTLRTEPSLATGQSSPYRIGAVVVVRTGSVRTQARSDGGASRPGTG